MENCFPAKKAEDVLHGLRPNDRNTMHFFGAANSAIGFVSFFEDIFGSEKIDRVYILGGGPGCGKSTLLKKIARISENREYPTQLIHCSSNPDSLDGVLIESLSCAVLDGTPPHTYPVKLPGAVEKQIDLGAAWDTAKLAEMRDELRTLSEKKSALYRKAYIELRAAKLLADECRELTEPFILSEKMQKSAHLVAEKCIPVSLEKTFRCDKRLLRCVGGKGNLYFDTFSDIAENVYGISDSKGIAGIYLEALLREAETRKARVIVSYCPEDTSQPDGLYFPDSRTAFSVYTENCERNINCERFIDKGAVSRIRQKYSFAKKCRDSILCDALSSLCEANAVHDEIEKHYFSATDFSVTESIGEKLINEIFGHTM